MENMRLTGILEILRDCYKPREHGWMWMLAQPPGADHGVMQEITGERIDNESIVGFVVDLAPRLGDVEMLVAVCRRDGRPTEADRELWRALRDHLDGTDARLIDMVVFNGDGLWSMREEDARSNAVA
jgi:hypothetical protein